jgi:2-phosphosulfolactate phosphatase
VKVDFEWGEHGVARLAPRCELLIIVDILSFSTTVDLATARGAAILPFPSRDPAAAEAFAQAHAAHLAGSRWQITEAQPYSLAPSSVVSIPTGTRLVLPSPNGSTLTRLAAEHVETVIAGCLRNASAVAAYATQYAKSVGVIAAGERWRDDHSIRFAVEDLLGAGAIIHALGATTCSPEAALAALTFRTVRPRLGEYVHGCQSGVELVEAGYAEDVALAVQLDGSTNVPLLRDGAYFGIST